MAKSTVKQDQAALGKEFDSLSKLQNEWDKLLDKKSKGKKFDEERLKQLEKEFGTYNKLAGKVDRIADTFNSLNKNVAEHNKRLEDSIENYDDMDDALTSIGSRIGKNDAAYQGINKKIEKSKEALGQISSILQGQNQLNERQEGNILKAAESYKGFLVDVADASKKIDQGNISQEQYNQIIKESYENLTGMVDLIDDSTEAGKQLKAQFQAMAQESKSFYDASMKSLGATQKLDDIMGSFSGIPAMGELNTLLKTNIKDTLAFKAAVFALGAALGKAAMDYFGAPIKTAMEQYKQSEQNRIDTEANIGKLQVDAQSIPKQIEQERLENRINSEGEIARLQQEAAFAGAKAAIQFSAQMQSGAAAFERAAKTALFGNKIGSVGYGAAQLQLAGISADQIASGMEAASAATGRMPSARVGADMAIMAERTGASVDNIASINEMFQRMDGVSESTAMNLSEGLRNMADQAKIGLGGLMREIADASKDALSYQIKSGPALAKQVAYAQSLGVSFGDIAKAGKSMVMNYKDSIKNEMQLSAMLGKNVDLSEVRAKFASGDTAGAMESLKAQGLDPAQMDMFQQDALSQALGGMDLSSLQKIATKQGAQVGGLKAGNAGAGNQDFLARTQAAESALNSKQASISAQTAILDAQLSQKIADSYLASGDYQKLKENQNKAAQEAEKLAGAMNDAWIKSGAFAKQMTESTKLGFVTGLLENIVSGIAMLLGGTILSKMMGGGGLMKSIGGMIPGLGGGGAAAASAASAAPAAMGAGGPGAAPTAGPAGGAGGGGFTKGLTDSVKNTSKVIQSVIKELGAVLKTGVDMIMQIVNKMASGVMTAFNTVMNGLSKASSTLPTILGNLGKAVGAFFSGMTTGLTTFAMAMAAPTPLFGLPVGLIVVGMAMGLAQALSIAGPGIEKLTPLLLGLASIIGDTFVKVLQTAGPIIKEIFSGIATVINSMGNAVSTIINSITSSISGLSSLDPVKMLAVAGGIAAMAGAVALYGGASILGAIGSFFGGSVFDDLKDISSYADPIMATAVAVDSLANAFDRLSSIDVSSLKDIPWGDMEDFASEGGKFVLASSGGGSFALSKETTDNIKKMATNTEVMAKLNNTIAKLLKEGFFGSETSTMKLFIDGKDVSTSMKRYQSNTQNQDPNKK